MYSQILRWLTVKYFKYWKYCSWKIPTLLLLHIYITVIENLILIKVKNKVTKAQNLMIHHLAPFCEL